MVSVAENNDIMHRIHFISPEAPLIFLYATNLSPFSILQPSIMNIHPCAARHLCGMVHTPITNPQHHCMHCQHPMHGALCGRLWSERGSSILITYGKCSAHSRGRRPLSCSGTCPRPARIILLSQLLYLQPPFPPPLRISV